MSGIERQNPLKLDATETAFFKRQLESVKAKTYDTKYRNLHSQMLIPMSTEHPAGTDFIIWYSFSKAGTAKIVANYATDYPRVDIYAEENENKVVTLGASYGYSIKEIRRAQLANSMPGPNVSLDMRRADTCRRSIEEIMDRLVWFGDNDYGMNGFFNYPGITSYTIPDAAGGGVEPKKWANKTSDEIIADLTGIVSAITVPTRGREEPNMIIIPREQYDLIRNKRMEGDANKTVLMFYMDNNPGVMIKAVDELRSQGAGGTDMIMAYVMDPNNVVQEICQPFEQLDFDKKGGLYEVPCQAEFGGVIVFYPQSVAYGIGI